MPILGFTGLPGHGKSYGVIVNVIVPALLKGRTVVTNIPVEREAMRAFLHAEGVRGPLRLLSINIDDFASGAKTFEKNIPDGAVVVLDELWRLWPAGLKANNASDDHKSFLAEHRHRVGDDGKTIEIVLVTQDLTQISNFARILVERTYCVFKLKEVGATNRYRVDIYAGIRSSGKGGQLINQKFGKYDAKYFALYKSHTKSDAVGVEEEADTRGTVFNAAVVRFGIPGGIALFLFCCWGVWRVWGNMFFGGEGVAEAAEPEPVTFSRSVSAPVETIPEVYREAPVRSEAIALARDSTRWRVAGIIESEAFRVAILEGEGRRRHIPLTECVELPGALLEYRCTVDGEVVTPWTGQGSSLGRTLGVVQN